MGDVEVVVVGGGHSGCSVAYHLARAGVETLLLEAGKVGRGCDDYLGGSAGPSVFPRSKMVLSWPESDLAGSARRFGGEFVRSYLCLLREGRDLQRTVAESFDASIVRPDGTFVTAEYVKDKRALIDDVRVLHSLGYPLKVIDRAGFRQRYGADFDGCFVEGDFIIDQQAYIDHLVRHFDYVEGCRLLDFDSDDSGALVRSSNGDVSCDYLVLATNAFCDLPLLRPCWSHAVCFESDGPDLPNCFTYADDYFDFTREDGVLQVGGCSTPKLDSSPCEWLALEHITDWASRHFDVGDVLEHHYGVYASTSDGAPVCGLFGSNSKVLLIGGCNAVGQSSLSYAASLVPGILGYSRVYDEDMVSFLSPLRQSFFRA